MSYFWRSKMMQKGGPGSGNHGHAGVHGQQGGSAPAGLAPRSSEIGHIQDNLRRASSGMHDVGSKTYISSMSSPNMGTRTFIDVKLPAGTSR